MLTKEVQEAMERDVREVREMLSGSHCADPGCRECAGGALARVASALTRLTAGAGEPVAHRALLSGKGRGEE